MLSPSLKHWPAARPLGLVTADHSVARQLPVESAVQAVQFAPLPAASHVDTFAPWPARASNSVGNWVGSEVGGSEGTAVGRSDMTGLVVGGKVSPGIVGPTVRGSRRNHESA